MKIETFYMKIFKDQVFKKLTSGFMAGFRFLLDFLIKNQQNDPYSRKISQNDQLEWILISKKKFRFGIKFQNLGQAGSNFELYWNKVNFISNWRQ